jgi:hypothetical protein
MARTEKRFGDVNQPVAGVPEVLVPAEATTRNLSINVATRGAAVIGASIYSGAYSNEATGTINIASVSQINSSNMSTHAVATVSSNRATWFGKYSGNGVFILSNSNTTKLLSIDSSTGSVRYASVNTTAASSTYSLRIPFTVPNFKSYRNGNSTAFHSNIVAVSPTEAISILSNNSTSIEAYDLAFGAFSYSHTEGSSLGALTYVSGGQNTLQAPQPNSSPFAGAYALQSGVGILIHADIATSATTTNAALGMYIYGPSSTSFAKRAYWLSSATAGKTPGVLLSYFNANDYNPTSGEFAFSQPSTTTLWSGIAPSASTSFPAGYAIPSEAAPAGFRIVSNSGTTDPTTNFLTGTITYPSAPIGVTVQTGTLPVAAIKFSPDGNMVAVAYSRNYSGTGDTNSVVVVYTNIAGTWTHTHSSGSALQRMPNGQDSMTWSADGGSIAVSATTSSTNQNSLAGTYATHIWTIGTSAPSGIPNSAITSWTVTPTKYPPFADYISPNTGSSKYISTSISTSSAAVLTSTTTTFINSISPTYTAPYGYFVANIAIDAASNANQLIRTHNYVPSGQTVGTSSRATNYVSTVISDYSMTDGQLTQVSNIVLKPNESLVVESSTADVDISANGVEIV